MGGVYQTAENPGRLSLLGLSQTPRGFFAPPLGMTPGVPGPAGTPKWPVSSRRKILPAKREAAALSAVPLSATNLPGPTSHSAGQPRTQFSGRYAMLAATSYIRGTRTCHAHVALAAAHDHDAEGNGDGDMTVFATAPARHAEVEAEAFRLRRESGSPSLVARLSPGDDRVGGHLAVDGHRDRAARGAPAPDRG